MKIGDEKGNEKGNEKKRKKMKRRDKKNLICKKLQYLLKRGERA